MCISAFYFSLKIMRKLRFKFITINENVTYLFAEITNIYYSILTAITRFYITTTKLILMNI